MQNVEEIWRLVEAKRSEFCALSDLIWDTPELNFTEYRSAEAHRAMLEREGFRVTAGIAGMPTAVIRELQPPTVHEVRELQTALGLVAAESGICLVPASVKQFRRDNVEYRPLDEEKAISPIIMSSRKGDRSPEVALILKLIREMYRKDGITFGE